MASERERLRRFVRPALVAITTLALAWATSGLALGDTNLAVADCSVTEYHVAYDGHPHTAKGICTGVGGVNLTADLNLSATTHTDTWVGMQGDPWTFSSPGYEDQSGISWDDIHQAQADCHQTQDEYYYDGNPHTGDVRCLGVLGEVLSGVSSGKFTDVGGYTVNWGLNPNSDYAEQTGTATFSISPAAPICSIMPYNVGFDGSDHTATGTCHAYGGALAVGLDLRGTTHPDVGDYPTDAWVLSDSNFQPARGTVHDTIAKAAHCTITPYDATYNAADHTARGTCIGDGGAVLDGLVLSGTSHTDAGNYGTDAWSFHDSSGVYADQIGTVADGIQKATATCIISGYTVLDDGSPHMATGSCTSAFETPTGLNLSATTHTTPGTYSDAWTFSNPNYLGDGATVVDSIQNPVLHIAVSASLPGGAGSYGTAGQVIGYRVTLFNTGDTAVADPYVSDPSVADLHCGTLPATLAPGGSIVCTASHTVTQADINAGAVTNTATGAGKWGETPLPTATDSATVLATQHPQLVLHATAAETSYGSGDVVHFSFVLTNGGNVPLSGPFSVSAGTGTVTCPGTPASLAPGASITCTSSYTITAADVIAGSVAATATAHAAFGQAAVDSDANTVTIERAADPTPKATPTPGRRATPAPTSTVEPGRSDTSNPPLDQAICILLSCAVAASCFRRRAGRERRV
jgi:hypothetical protein